MMHRHNAIKIVLFFVFIPLIHSLQYIKINQLVVEEADEVLLFLTAATDYLPVYPVYKRNDYKNISESTPNKLHHFLILFLKKAHLADHGKYFNRFIYN